MGPRAGVDGRKISSPQGFDPGPTSPVAQSLYRLSYPTHLSCEILLLKHVPKDFCEWYYNLLHSSQTTYNKLHTKERVAVQMGHKLQLFSVILNIPHTYSFREIKQFLNIMDRLKTTAWIAVCVVGPMIITSPLDILNKFMCRKTELRALLS